MKYLKLDQYFEFGFNTQRFDTGAETDADSLPYFRVYEENNDTCINQQNCAKRDDANTTGYYYARGHVTAAVGTGTGQFDYEVGKCYEVRVTATVNSVTGSAVVGRFMVLPDNVWDSLFGGTDNLQVDATQIGGTAQTGRDLGKNLVTGTVDSTGFTPTATEFEADDITEATADHYNGRVVIFTSGNLLNQAATISDYALVGGRGHFTVPTMTEAPANNDTFTIY